MHLFHGRGCSQLPSPGLFFIQIKVDGRSPVASPPMFGSGNYRKMNAITVELLDIISKEPTISSGTDISISTRRIITSSGNVVSQYSHPAHLLRFSTSSKRLSCNSVQVDLVMSGSVDWRVAGPQEPIDDS